MNSGLSGRAAIVGIGATEFSKDSGRSELRLAAEAVRAALADAGLEPADVDGLVTFTMDNNTEIAVARDGAEALDYLYSRGAHADRTPGEPAVVLLDLKLPKVDGLEVLRTVRATEGLRSTPVVMLTSSNEEADVVRSYELGVNAYVVKPVEFNQFLRAIADLGVFWAVVNEPPPGVRRVGA